MNTLEIIFDLLSTNQVLGGLAVLVLGGLFAWAIKNIRDRRDMKRVYEFLQKSTEATAWTYRSTQSIASGTKLPEGRVEMLCALHPRIRRNEKEKQSWRVEA